MKYTVFSFLLSFHNLAHEVRHGYGYLVGELSGTRFGIDPLADMTDEVAGYRTGALFTSEAHLALTFGVEDFRPATTDPRSKYYYIRDRDVSLSISSPISLMIKYSTDGILNNALKNSINSNISIGEALNIVNKQSLEKTGYNRYLWGENLKRSKK